MKPCPNCSEQAPNDANYCPHCGYALFAAQRPSLSDESALKPDFRMFWLSLFLSVGLTAFFVLVLGMPVFLFGLFLPFLWQLRPRRQR